MSSVHTHHGKLCYVEDCMLDRDRASDRVIPLRIVENTGDGSLVVRCVALLTNGHGCPEEWDIGPYGDPRGSQVWADALGHVATQHRY